MSTPSATRPYRATLASFRTAVAIAALLTTAAAAGIALLLLRPGALAALGDLTSNRWWFSYRDPGAVPPTAAVWRIIAAAAAAGIGIVAAFRAFVLFARSASPLLPFLVTFFFSLSLECLRAGTALLYAADGSIGAGIVLTRIIYWGRFAGLLSLLIAGLYCVDMKYRRFGMLWGAIFLVSFAMAAYIPVDRTVFLAQLTWRLGDEQGVWFVHLILGILVVLTSAGGVLVRRDRRFLWLAGGMLLLLASREILYFSTSPLILAAGLISLAAGSITSLRVLAVVYRKAAE
jgi:hypothetical protein